VSQTTVMAALGTWFGGTPVEDPAPEAGVRRYSGGPITGLGMLYAGFPERFPASDFTADQPAGAEHGAIGVLRLEDPHEVRVALGPQGLRRISHPVTFHLYHRSTAKHAEDARTHLRALQDELAARLRSDPTLGGAVFTAGESDTGPGSGVGNAFRTNVTASSGGRHETRSDWTFTVVEYTSPEG
jgi:hypothetical protein